MLIKGAVAYVGGKFRKCDILIEKDRIAKIANRIDIDGEEVIMADGLVALPGLIEIHTHLWEQGRGPEETFVDSSKAALAGGYTLMYDMPNNAPNITDTKKAYEAKKTLAKKALCELRFHFGATEHNFEEVRKANPESIKIFLDKDLGPLAVSHKAALKHMQMFPKEKPVLIHAQAGDTVESSLEGIRKAVELARIANRKIHFLHTSTVKEVEIAKSWELATVDTAPQYLFTSREDAAIVKPEDDELGHPALRSRKEVIGMWKSLDKIDALATDHAVHYYDVEKKDAKRFPAINTSLSLFLYSKTRNLWAHGFPGMETALALFLDAYSKGRVSLEWIAQRFSENPAKIMGLSGYGKIAEGYVANVTLVNLKKAWKVNGSKFYTKCKCTPFEGMRLKGRVVKTIYKGKVAYHLE